MEVKIKRPVDLAARIPEWVAPRDTWVQINGADRTPSWAGRYGHGDLSHIRGDGGGGHQKRKYTLVRRGNEIVDIYPKRQHSPYYRREQYRTGQPHWLKVTRYVSDRPISWEIDI